MERQLRDLMEAGAGEPPHRVTVAAVRRRVIRRRVLEGVSGAAAVALLAWAGVAVAAIVPGPAPVSTDSPGPGGPPPYYVQMSGDGHFAWAQQLIVRATATQQVTDQAGSPWPGSYPVAIAAAGTRDQVIYSVWSQGPDVKRDVTGSRIYRFRLTPSGRATRYTLVRGGDLGAQSVESWPGALAVSPDGSRVAVTVRPGAATSTPTSDIEVINTATGQHAIWRDDPNAQGTVLSDPGNLAFAEGGRELGFGSEPCPDRNPRCYNGVFEVRVLRVTAAGGELSGGRVVFKLTQLTGQLNEFTNYPDSGNASFSRLTPDGSAVRTAISTVGPSHKTMLVVQFPVGGGPMSVLYRGASLHQMSIFNSFSFDPTGNYMLLNAGDRNGWVKDGKLIPLPQKGTAEFTGPQSQQVW